jgi:hypothetical protein
MFALLSSPCHSARFWVFPFSADSYCWCDDAFGSGRGQAAWLSDVNHGSIGDSWPIAFSGCPRGHTVNQETRGARSTLSA